MSNNPDIDKQIKRLKEAGLLEPTSVKDWVNIATDNQPNDGSLGWSQDGEWVWRGKDKQTNTGLTAPSMDEYSANGLVIEYKAILAKGKEDGE